MIVLGVTGSIGTGKSAACQILLREGIPVHDSDRAVHDALSGPARNAVAKFFPAAIDRTGRINRHVLGQIIFKDPSLRTRLENLLHPYVWTRQRDFLLQQRRNRTAICALDIPLLFETMAETKVDYTLCMRVSSHLQTRRVLARSGMTNDKFNAITARQWPTRIKAVLADFIIDSGLGYACMTRQLKNAIAMIRDCEQSRLQQHA